MAYLTMQEIFNGVYIQAQKKIKCINRVGSIQESTIGSCLYRNYKNECCFIGALIADDVYDKSMEHHKGNRVLVQAKLLPELDRNSPANVAAYYDYEVFIAQLQKVHDSFPIATWNGALAKIAEQYHLQLPAIPTASASVSV